MSDAMAIAGVKARYCAAADLAATDTASSRAVLARVLADEIVADYGTGPIVGRDAVIAFLCDSIGGNSTWSLHMIHTPDIVTAGDEGSGTWTLAVHVRRRATGAQEVVIGRYADRFVREGDGWRIATIWFDRPA